MEKKRIAIRIILILIFCSLGFLLATFSLQHKLSSFSSCHISKETTAVNATPERIREALKSVYDLELGISVVDLGLVRNIEALEDNTAVITIIFTAPFCPYADFMIASIKKNVRSIEGIDSVEVKVDTTSAWLPEMMTE
ncbi:metal-sulfur cluster assembly factor, partial [Candidatus Omnitrophota bacterium]